MGIPYDEVRDTYCMETGMEGLMVGKVADEGSGN